MKQSTVAADIYIKSKPSDNGAEGFFNDRSNE